MTEATPPTLFVCHGDEKSPAMHPCGKVQKRLKEAGIAYEKVIAAKGNPIPFLRKDDRGELEAATGQKKLPALRLTDGTVLVQSKDILGWIDAQGTR